MSGVLKGNFQTKNEVTTSMSNDADDLEKEFEKESLKHLGGSIAFVSKKKVLWPDDPK